MAGSGLGVRDSVWRAASALRGIATGRGEGWRQQVASRAAPVATATALPAEADVVVIGAGIAGVSTALFLNEYGLRVVVLEKGAVAGEQSSRAFGWIYSAGWHPDKLPLAERAKQLWQGFGARFGTDIGYRQTGSVALLADEGEVAAQRDWLEGTRAVWPQTQARIVTGAAMDAVIPGSAGRFAGILHDPTDGTAESFSTSRIAEGAIAEGVRIVAPFAARTVLAEGGRITGVATDRGIVACGQVVVAGGAWTPLFLGNLGVRLAQLSLSSSMQRLSPVAGELPGLGYGPDFIWRRMADGGTAVGVFSNSAPITRDSIRLLPDFLRTLPHARGLLKLRLSPDLIASLRAPRRWGADDVSPFEAVRVLGGRVEDAALDLTLGNLRRAWPQYEAAQVEERWAGVVDATPDSTPFIGPVPDRPGLWAITGFSGNGLTTGPAAGEMLAQMIAGRETVSDPSLYRLVRLRDGSAFVFRH